MKGRTCELCSGDAALYCMSDSAFLCWSCDARVHEANFLVARHVRRTICATCKQFDGNRVSGVGLCPRRSFCQSCLDDGIMSSDYDHEHDFSSSSSSSSSSSTCISSAKSIVRSKITSTTRRVSSSVSDISSENLARNCLKKTQNTKKGILGKGILVNWCRKLSNNNNSGSSIHKLAMHAFSTCLREMTNLPYRVSLASSLWLALKFFGTSTCQDLKRVQDVSGVPMKLILIGEKKIARVLKMNGGDWIDLEEGCAESND